MKRLGYYPGCSLPTMASEYDASLRNVCARLEISLDEIPGWICCGASPAGSCSRLLGLTLPLQNLALARKAGHSELVAPCSACFYHFKKALAEVEADAALRADAEAVLESQVDGSVRPMHPLQVLVEQVGEEKIRSAVVRDLSHLRVCCYYGCLLTRPPEVMQFDAAENPRSMDDLLRWVGVKPLPWDFKTDCCGAIYAVIDPSVVVRLTARILQAAEAAGADAIVVACPFCQLNLDARQVDVNRTLGTSYRIPVVYFTQILGFAMGIDESGLGLWRLVVDAEGLLRRAARP